MRTPVSVRRLINAASEEHRKFVHLKPAHRQLHHQVAASSSLAMAFSCPVILSHQKWASTNRDTWNAKGCHIPVSCIPQLRADLKAARGGWEAHARSAVLSTFLAIFGNSLRTYTVATAPTAQWPAR